MEVRGLPQPRQMLMIIDEKMEKVRDLATKLKFVCKDIKKTDEIKIHRDRFLLPDKENINIIETGEKIIAFINATETEYVEYEDNKETLLKVRMDILKEQENKLEIKEKELKEKEEAFVKRKDDEETLLNVRMEALKENENKLEIKEKELNEKEEAFVKSKDDEETLVNARMEVLNENQNKLEIKEMELDDKEAFLKNWEDNLEKKGEDFTRVLTDMERINKDLKMKIRKTAERSRERKRKIVNVAGVDLSSKDIKLMKTDPSFTNEDLMALGLLGEMSSCESGSDSDNSIDSDY